MAVCRGGACRVRRLQAVRRVGAARACKLLERDGQLPALAAAGRAAARGRALARRDNHERARLKGERVGVRPPAGGGRGDGAADDGDLRAARESQWRERRVARGPSACAARAWPVRVPPLQAGSERSTARARPTSRPEVPTMTPHSRRSACAAACRLASVRRWKSSGPCGVRRRRAG